MPIVATVEFSLFDMVVLLDLQPRHSIIRCRGGSTAAPSHYRPCCDFHSIISSVCAQRDRRDNGSQSPSVGSAQCSTNSPLRNASTACSCADGSSPATTVATITSQRSLKASDSTDFAGALTA